MNGTIELVSLRQTMIGVRTEKDEFSVLELVGGYSPEIGDAVIGNLESLGRETTKNVTQGESWDVYIQDIHGSKKVAMGMLSKF